MLTWLLAPEDSCWAPPPPQLIRLGFPFWRWPLMSMSSNERDLSSMSEASDEHIFPFIPLRGLLDTQDGAPLMQRPE